MSKAPRSEKISQDATPPWSTRPHNRHIKEYSFTFRTIMVARRYRALLDDRLRPLGYGCARMETLATIAHSDRLSAQTEIAKRIGIEGPTLTRMLDALEAEGLVASRWEVQASGPARKVYALTETGQQELARRALTWREFADAVERVLKGAGDVPQPA